MTEAAMGGRSGEPVGQFRRSLQHHLAENAEHLDRLNRVVRQLAGIRLTVGISRGKQAEPGKLQQRLARLAFALGEAPTPPPILTADNRLVVEAVRRVDGSVVMLAPRSGAAG